MLVNIVGKEVIRPGVRPGTFGIESELWNKLNPEEQRAISSGALKALGTSLALVTLGLGGIIYLGTRVDLNDPKSRDNPPIVKSVNNHLGNK